MARKVGFASTRTAVSKSCQSYVTAAISVPLTDGNPKERIHYVLPIWR